MVQQVSLKMHRISIVISLALIASLSLFLPDANRITAACVVQPNEKQEQTSKHTYASAAAPLFKKYCNSCHNSEDVEGGLSLTTPKEISQGGENGPALLPGNAKASRMIRMIAGELEPRMPPDDMPGPSEKELQQLMSWIDDGAKIDARSSLNPQKLIVPDVETKVSTDPVTDLSWSPDGKWIAVARYQRVDILSGKTKKLLFQLKDHPGKVNSVSFSSDSRFLLAATGVTGLKGMAVEWDLETRKKRQVYEGHSDVIYTAEFSPDSSMVATAGYDRKIVLWKRAAGNEKAQVIRQLTGHNGAIYDLEFSSKGAVLASASGDQTVKLWNSQTGERLDTLGQPLKEQFVARFHPTSDYVLGAGRDNRIRLWRLVSRSKSAINPLLISRFAHEASIIALAFSRDGSLLVSSAEDRTIKVWSGTGIELITSLPGQKDIAYGLALSPENELAVGRLDGSVDFYRLSGNQIQPSLAAKELDLVPSVVPNSTAGQPLASINEQEPNSSVSSAQTIKLPATIQGTLDSTPDQRQVAELADADIFRFQANQGETWVFETNASRSKSPADTKIQILDLEGNPVQRAKLQAVRDSYFTFRGKDANTSDDFRVHNWEEMELNELLYCNGEIVRLFLYPRGPDSGFKVYPGFGTRHNFYDTTPVAHALQEPCYIVKAFSPDSVLTPNGLPVFNLYYENDDDAKRKLGSDSKLFFTAPQKGEYLVKVSDSRGFQGPQYKYSLTIRSAQPDFSVGFSGKKMTLMRGSGREFNVNVNRVDNFNGAVDVLFENLPEGIYLPEKITIEENHFQAFGSGFASAKAPQPTPEQISKIKITAVAKINGKEVRKDLGQMQELKLLDSPKIQARIVPSISGLTPEQTEKIFSDENNKPIVLNIRPGTTISASLIIKRLNHGGDVDFGNADSGRNLPHGVFVDNIGLNGLRIIKGQGDAREVFITAAKWVPPQTRLFHLKANNVGGETTVPVLLNVVK